MRNLTVGLAAASLLAFSPAANAAVTLTGGTVDVDTFATEGNTTTIGYASAGLADEFTETLMFNNDLAALYTLTLNTSSKGVDFISAILEGTGGIVSLFEFDDDGFTESWKSLPEQQLAAGDYTLTITGTNSLVGSLGGTVTIESFESQTPSEVPEPGTWAMMLLGFGAIGAGMRRRKAVTSRVKYNFA